MFPTRFSVFLIFVLFAGAAAAQDGGGCDAGSSFSDTSSCDNTSFTPSGSDSFVNTDLTPMLMATVYNQAAIDSAQSSTTYRLNVDGQRVAYQDAYKAVAALLIPGKPDGRSERERVAILNAAVEADLVGHYAFALPLLEGMGGLDEGVEARMGERIDKGLAREFLLRLNLLVRAQPWLTVDNKERLASKARFALYILYSRIENARIPEAQKKKEITDFLSLAVQTLPASEYRRVVTDFVRSVAQPANVARAEAYYRGQQHPADEIFMGTIIGGATGAGLMIGTLLLSVATHTHLLPGLAGSSEPLLLLLSTTLGPMVGGGALGATIAYWRHRLRFVPFAQDQTRLASAVRHCRTLLGTP